MTAVLDQTGDSTRREFYRCSRLYDLPDYVKSADVETIFGRDSDIASTGFADVRNRQFKCTTKAATWVSYLYFLENRSKMHHKIAEWTQERLDRFAAQWGITPDVAAMQEKNAELQQERLTDSDYMYVWSGDNGTRERAYPLRNGLEVKKAAEWFCKHRDHFAYADRRTMATKLLEKSSEFGTGFDSDTAELLEKQAGNGTYVPAEAAQFIRERSLLSPNSPFREKIAEMADKVADNPYYATCPETIKTLCETIDVFDRTIKLAGQYTENVPRPEEIFCSVGTKVAKAAIDECCTLTTGRIYHTNSFAKLALADIRDAFGNEIAEEVSTGLNVDPQKFAEIAGTFPRPDAQLLDQILADNNIQPMLKHATALKGPDFSELKGLAALA